jgi:hypothetical protein
MQNNKIILIFPKGGGGSWLGNLSWHLENQEWTIPSGLINFDQEPQGSIIRVHDRISYMSSNKSTVFSTKKVFNLYLNYVKKIYYPIHQINKLPDSSRIFMLSDIVQTLINEVNSDQHPHFKKIDLDYELIFSDEDEFINNLYKILDKERIKYTKNTSYIKSSMTNYRSTCESPKNHIGTNSFEWLGFCLAMARIKHIHVPEWDLNKSIDTAIANLNHLQQPALEFVKPYTFEWQS